MTSTPQRIGTYLLQEVISTTEQTRLYRANHHSLGTAVTLMLLSSKLCHCETERLFSQAADCVLQQHGHLIKVLDGGYTEQGAAYLVTEPLQAPTLDTLPPLSLTRFFPIALQLCALLESLHQQGITLRELLPKHFALVQQPGYPDFLKYTHIQSLQKRNSHHHPWSQPTNTQPDTSQNIYAVGLLLYRLLHGIPSKSTVPRAEIPPWLNNIIVRCLQREPSKRPSSAAAVGQALAAGVGLSWSVFAEEFLPRTAHEDTTEEEDNLEDTFCDALDKTQSIRLPQQRSVGIHGAML
jgi:serine/threonine protein kinase